MLIPLGIFGDSQSGWISLLSGSSNQSGVSTTVDASGNVYIIGFDNSSGTQVSVTAKYNSLGALQWQRKMSTSGAVIPGGVTVDTSGNVFSVFSDNGASTAIIVKYNSSGTLQYQRSFTSASAIAGEATNVTIDSSGNQYIVGNSIYLVPGAVSYSNGLSLTKYNSSGTIQWQVGLGSEDSSYGGSGANVTTDSSGNVYVTGRQYPVAPDIITAKYNSSGTLQWQRVLSSGSTDAGNGIAVDSSGNIYVAGTTSSNAYLAKYNSSGTLQWQKIINGGSDHSSFGVTVDSSDFIYIVGYSNITGGFIIKYNSSGALILQRQIGFTLYSIDTDSQQNMYVTGTDVSSSGEMIIAKLPDDGSLTGTYTVGGTSITYGTSGLTSGDASLSSSAGSLIASTLTASDSASSLTSATSTLTSNTTAI